MYSQSPTVNMYDTLYDVTDGHVCTFSATSQGLRLYGMMSEYILEGQHTRSIFTLLSTPMPGGRWSLLYDTSVRKGQKERQEGRGAGGRHRNRHERGRDVAASRSRQSCRRGAAKSNQDAAGGERKEEEEEEGECVCV